MCSQISLSVVHEQWFFCSSCKDTWMITNINIKMDFTDPIVAEEEVSKVESGQGNSKSNEQTQNAIDRLEEDIDTAYSVIESKFSSLWANASQSAQGLQEKMKFEERKNGLIDQINISKESINNNKIVQEKVHSVEKQLKDLGEQIKTLESGIGIDSISSHANKALDSLDSKLEIVEQQAGKLVSLFTSFFSNIVSIDSPQKEIRETETIFTNPGIAGAAYNSTRFDSDLFKLHTSELFYLDDAFDIQENDSNFDIDEKTDEISNLLKKYPDTLEKLMNKLVPVDISYRDFWSRYFAHEQKLKENEQTRKEILSQNDVSKKITATHVLEEEGEEVEEEEEDFTWDDDDDDEDEDIDENAVSEDDIERVRDDKT